MKCKRKHPEIRRSNRMSISTKEMIHHHISLLAFQVCHGLDSSNMTWYFIKLEASWIISHRDVITGHYRTHHQVFNASGNWFPPKLQIWICRICGDFDSFKCKMAYQAIKAVAGSSSATMTCQMVSRLHVNALSESMSSAALNLYMHSTSSFHHESSEEEWLHEWHLEGWNSPWYEVEPSND